MRLGRLKRNSARAGPLAEWSYFGRIVPERVTLSVQVPEVQMELPVVGAKLAVTLNIHQCQIVAFVKVLSGNVDAYTLRNAVEDYCRNVADLIGYKSGMSFDVDMVSCTSSNGDWNVFASEIPILYEKRGGAPSAITSNSLNAIFTEPHASIALADFREAMRVPMQTGFFCYRAVEAMMQSMKVSPNDKDAPAWVMLKETLRIDEQALFFIKSHADWARHGKVGNITDKQRADLFVITDEIIGRYLAYLEGGGVPLGAAFDILESPPETKQ